MAYNASNVPTLLDLANISDADGKVTSVIEILNETNEILKDMSWMEGNLPTGHRTSIRTGIPRPTWRKLYGFVQPTKSTTAQVTEQCGMLEAFAEVDCALADLNGNTAAFRLSEDRAHIEGMNQEMCDTIFYGDDDDAAFIGLAPRFNALTGAENSDNVIDGKNAFSSTAGVAGDTLNSAWLIVWGPNTIQGIVPKASKSGLSMNDLGKQMIQGTNDTSTNAEASPGRMMAYTTHYRWDAGISVRDWRYAVRIANLPVNKGPEGITSSTPNFVTIPELMHNAMDRIPNMNGGRAAWYMSRRTRELLRQSLSRLHADSMLKMEDIGGTMTESFMGIPVRRVDQLARDENLLA